MNDIDLIPDDYRKNRQILADLRAFSLAAVIVILIVALVSAVLKILMQSAQTDAEKLSGQQLLIDQKSAQLQTLDEQIKSMSEQLSVLSGFRGGQTAPRLLVAIDRALDNSEVWFARLSFGRAGSMVDKKEAATSNGYFIVLPKQNESDTEKAWQIETHLEVLGYARNYAKLSAFVGELLKQAEVRSVKIIRSGRRVVGGNDLVEFELAILVNPGRRR
ncbi:hypothetical protein [Litorivivens sp.]|uniref:hypothetical protein n=1 Tax=Litorivivens sp. TaxID=2020868 RepID=UPI003569CC79